MAAIGRHNLFFGGAKLSYPSSAPLRRFATPPLAKRVAEFFVCLFLHFIPALPP